MWRRKPIVAGSFYPGKAKELDRDIDLYMKQAGEKKLTRDIVCLFSPHAGYIYSGQVAAHSYREILGMKLDVVVVLAPSHRGRFDGASVIPEGIYGTPLGDVPVDGVIGAKLMESAGFGFIREAHEYEHSLEVQVPFLQKVLDGFAIVPVVLGTTDLDVCRTVAQGITAALAGEGRKWMMVVSTDLSHYHPYAEAKTLDHAFAESLKSFNEQEVKRVLASGKAEACGEGPVLAGLIAGKALGGNAVEVLKYANSGDSAGDKDKVVGYLAAAIVK